MPISPRSRKFSRNCSTQTSGKVFYCADDANAVRICRSSERAISYGFAENADYRGADIELHDFASTFRRLSREKELGEAVLNVPGQHNVHNALGVIALATELGIPFEKIAKSLAKFRARAAPIRNQIRERAVSAGRRLRASSDRNPAPR